jgi:hypothetical protein
MMLPLTYTTSIDPYNGKEIKTAHGGNHVEVKIIEVTIKNQPYTEVNVKTRSKPKKQPKPTTIL